MKFLILCLSLLALPIAAYAIFCPSNFNNIDIGDSIEQVLKQCGPPASQNTYTLAQPVAEQWDYYIRTNPFNRTTSKMSVVFKDNQVINITLNITATTNNLLCQEALDKKLSQTAIETACNQSTQKVENASWTTICGPIIRIGSTPENVEAACGAPVFVTKSQSQSQTPSTQITEYKYNVPSPNILIFENGILKLRK